MLGTQKESLSDEAQALLVELRGREHKFVLDTQIALCAELLVTIQKEMGPQWRQLGRAGNRNDMNQEANFREKKELIKSIIRVCSESVDYFQTADFVTSRALEIMIENRLHPKSALTLNLGHEHMVPCEAIFKHLTGHELNTGEVKGYLEQMSFRAVVERVASAGGESERARIDKDYRSKLPPLHEDYPLRFHPFARYEHVNLIGHLHWMNARAKGLYDAYLKERDSVKALLPRTNEV